MTGKQGILVAAVAVFAVLTATVRADERLDIRRDPVVKAVEKAAPAVVNISTEKIVQRGFFSGESPFDNPFFGGPVVANSLGSGGIFTPDGYIFTNAHVVDRASKITVTLGDGVQYAAELVNVDLATDVAVIKIKESKPLPFLVLGRSDDLLVGEKAIAVGNPFGLSNSVTTGVISATHRDVIIEDRVAFQDFLQTDALINPGNSGGPLLNVFGEVIGVNSAMRSDGQGIGFAIPVDRVKKSLAALMDYRKLLRLRLGFDVQEKYTGSGPQTALTVKSVDANGPAGIAVGDAVTAVGERPVSSLVDFMAAVLASGTESFTMAIAHDGQQREVSFTATQIPKPDGAKLAQSILGITVKQMGRSLSRNVGIDIDKGILVSDARNDSAGAQAGLEVGDVILQVNDTLTPDMDSFAAALEPLQNAGTIYLVIIRRQGMVFRQFLVEVPLRQLEKS